MHAKQVVAFFLFVAFSAALLTAIGSMVAPPPKPPEVDWSQVTDDPNETLTISWLGIPDYAVAEEGSFIERMVERQWNLEIKPVFLDKEAYSRKKALIFAGGNVPDLFWEPDPMILQRDVKHGFVLPIPYQVILDHAPTYVSVINEFAPVSWMYSRYQGRNWGIPTIWLNGRKPVPGLWRMDWLRRVGIDEPPRTLAEFEEALRRLRFGDPDGDGQRNTYGMSGDVGHWWWASFAEVFGAFGVAPYDWQVADGEVTWGGIRPEAKQALALLRSWYEQGLLDPELATDNATPGRSIWTKFAEGELGYMYYQGKYGNIDPQLFNSLQSKMRRMHDDPGIELRAGWFPVGPDGERGGRVWGGGGNIICFGEQVAHQPQKVLRVLRLIEDRVTDRELYVRTKIGLEGEHWRWRDPNVGVGSGIKRTQAYEDNNAARKAGLALGMGSGGFFVFGTIHPQETTMYNRRIEQEFNDRYRRPQWAIEDAFGKPDVVPSAGRYLGDLRAMQMQVYAEIILGRRPVDDFDEFVAEWRRRGGEQLLAEARQLYEVQKEVYRTVGVE